MKARALNCRVSCEKAIQVPAAFVVITMDPRQKQRLLGTGSSLGWMTESWGPATVTEHI